MKSGALVSSPNLYPPCVQDFVNKTLRLVRISLLIIAIQRVLRFFSGKVFYKSNRKLFSWVCIAWYKHSRRWENSRQLCKPETKSRVCITVSNSPNPSRVYIRLCKHGKRLLLLNIFAWLVFATFPLSLSLTQAKGFLKISTPLTGTR